MKLSLALFISLPLPLFAVLEQKSPPVRSADAPQLVWDIKGEALGSGYRNFRTTSDPVAARPGAAPLDLTGLAALHASGSSAYSPAGLAAMMKRFSGPVTVFDLRQEDHGFVDGQAVSWFATNNWANVGKSNAEIVSEEKARLGGLRPGTRVTITDDSAKKGEGGGGLVKAETVVSTETEEQLVRSAGAFYVRITVSDHSRPTDAEVDRFVGAVRQLPPGSWAHFHCRAGKGRTTTFLALYDMLRNARTVPLQAIADRQSRLAGDYNLLGKETEPGANAGTAADRTAFIRAFYAYARDNPGGQPKLWSEWLATQP